MAYDQVAALFNWLMLGGCVLLLIATIQWLIQSRKGR